MSDDLRVVGEGTLAAAQRWKARAETAEAEAAQLKKRNGCYECQRENERLKMEQVSLRDMARMHQHRADEAQTQADQLRAERDRLREALKRAIRGLRVTIRRDLNELADELDALASTTTKEGD